MDLGLKGKTVLITAPTQGIGKSVAELFSKNKTKCILVSRDLIKLNQLKNKLDKNIKGNIVYSCDLKNDEELNGFLSFLKKRKCPDFVVHNIGGTLSQKHPNVEYSKWLEVINFNVGIAIKINNYLIPKMKKNNNHKIVHISSISGVTYRGSAPYACSKTLLNSYIKTLGMFLAKKNIVVSGIMPGALFSKGGHWDKIKKTKPYIIKDFLRHHHAIQRFGYPEEVAIWALYLCSKYTTAFAAGSIINIDGGTH
jgi:3-oxoacyl-[acyl-carrier protein] reductase